MDVAQAKGPYQDSIEATSGSSPRSGGKTAMLRKYLDGSLCDTDNASAPFTACGPNEKKAWGNSARSNHKPEADSMLYSYH